MKPDAVKVAYADPPYPGQSKRWYSDHKDYAGEVDHAALLKVLGEYDGWALSTSAAALREVLPLCPATVRVAVWYRANSEPPGNRGRWHWSYEPLIVYAAREPLAPSVRDVLPTPKVNDRIPGQKPQAFCMWLFELVGARPCDEFSDLYPGSGAVTEAWSWWRSQMRMPV